MEPLNLYQKVWSQHTVQKGEDIDQIFIDTHLIHEVTSPQAFSMLKERKLQVLFPERTIATVDHIIPTDNRQRPFKDEDAESMMQALEYNTSEHNITLHSLQSKYQGIVHVMAPELGLIRPGMTVACGDSHTSTHGAFGAIAFGIGTTQVRDILATQTLKLPRLKVRRIEITGQLQPGVGAKDVILYILKHLGAKGGSGYAYEYTGTAIEKMSMAERMTLCNMSIEGGARCGYVNPDKTTVSYLAKLEKFKTEDIQTLSKKWLSWASDKNATYEDSVQFQGEEIEPMITWGISPDQVSPVTGNVSQDSQYKEAYDYMNVEPGSQITGTSVDVAFIGSCTNGRYEDFHQVSQYLEGHKVHSSIKRALAVPGSRMVSDKAEATGVAQIFRDAGFEWREPGCSMCLAMNPDRLYGNEVCASSSNRNFKGRQGSTTGRTMLMSPLSVAAAAVNGKVIDPREVFEI